MVIKDTIWYAPAAEPRGLHIYLPDNYDSTVRQVLGTARIP